MDEKKTYEAAPILGGFLFTTMSVATRIIVFMALLIIPVVAGTLLGATEGTMLYKVCRALPASMCYGLVYGLALFLAGKLVAVVSHGRFGGVSIDLAFVFCAVAGFAYAMVAA